MTKEIPCYECGGKGFYTKSYGNSAWVTTCEHCNGRGVVDVPSQEFKGGF